MKKLVWKYLWLTVASIIYSCGVSSFIDANKYQINTAEIHNINAKIVEFKKRRCDFVFNVDKILTQKQN